MTSEAAALSARVRGKNNDDSEVTHSIAPISALVPVSGVAVIRSSTPAPVGSASSAASHLNESTCWLEKTTVVNV